VFIQRGLSFYHISMRICSNNTYICFVPRSKNHLHRDCADQRPPTRAWEVARTVVAAPSSVVKCVWEVFVWGVVLVVCVCVSLSGGVVLCRCVCVCDLLIFYRVNPRSTSTPTSCSVEFLCLRCPVRLSNPQAVSLIQHVLITLVLRLIMNGGFSFDSANHVFRVLPGFMGKSLVIAVRIST